jgi:hypothetical protein
MSDLSITFVDTEPPPPSSDDTEPMAKPERPTVGTCSECGDTFPISNRGRVPSKCPKHRKSGGGGGVGKGRGRRKSRRSVGDYVRLAHEAITGLFVQPLGIAGMGTKHPGPLATAFVVGFQCSPQTAVDPENGQEVPTSSQYGPLPDAIGELALHHDKLADLLETFEVAVPYVKLTAAVLPIIPQTMANFGLIKPGAFGTADPHMIADVVRNQIVGAMSASFTDFGSMFEPEPSSNGARAN